MKSNDNLPNFIILFAKADIVKDLLAHPVISIIAETAWEMEVPAFIVGGFVRDIFLQRPSMDIDVVVLGSGIDLARRVAERTGHGGEVTVYRTFGTAMIRYHDGDKIWIIEFVGARKESYDRRSRKPAVETGSLADDQKRRDFTINALGISLQKKDFGTLIDPFNGLDDINRKIIRTPLDPGVTFSDDPLRMMRAVRFAAQLDFHIDRDTLAAIHDNRERIRIVSRERITDEFNKIIMAPRPSVGLLLLQKTQLLAIIFPQLVALKGTQFIDGKGHKDNFYHTLEVLDKVAAQSDNLWLRWATLLHDIGKPAVKKFDPATGWTFHGHDHIGAKMVDQIFRMLKLPLNEKMQYVTKLVQLHLRPQMLSDEGVTDSAIRRLLFEAGDDIDDLMLLCRADITSKNKEKVKAYMKNFNLLSQKLVEVEAKDKLRNWQPPVNGQEIMETFRIPPSKEVGIIKNAIREAILDGTIGNNHDEAFALMIEIGKKIGLKPAKNAGF